MKNHKMLIIAISILAVFATVDTAMATLYIVYVDIDATGNNDGTSWANAYNYLQDALDDLSPGDEVWIAEGTYYPDEGDTPTNDDRTEAFQLVYGCSFYGGFDGTESTRNERDWRNNETILSGDIDQDGVLDDDNAYHVTEGADDVILDGFTITGGKANHPSITQYRSGGGMYNNDCSYLEVANCIFSGNYGMSGGGMCNQDTNLDITNCTFLGELDSIRWRCNEELRC